MEMSYANLNRIFAPAAPMGMEGSLFDHASKFSDDYNGGVWTVEEIGGMPFAILPEGEYNVSVASNYYSGKMDHRTFGVALTLVLLNRIVWAVYESGRDHDAVTTRFHEMRNAAYNDDTLDTAAIAGFLD